MSFQKAKEAHEWHCNELDRWDGIKCPHGTTGHGMWLFGCADRALARVGDSAPAAAFWDALEEEEREDYYA